MSLSHTIQENSYKYLFGHYSSEDKVWYIQPRRFILLKNINKNLLTGQFIQSIWFNKSYTSNKSALFVVFKTKVDISCKKIEKDMNSLKNPFPTLYDIPPYISRYSYFNMPWQLVNQCIKEAKERNDFKFTIRAFNNPYDKLILTIINEPSSIYGNMREGVNNLDGIDNKNQSIMITLPSFEIPLD